MSFDAVRELETALGCSLPTDYRVFLSRHVRSTLEPQLLVRPTPPAPGSGEEDVVTEIYTASDILRMGRQGVADAEMLVVGSVQPSGYLYMCCRSGEVGAIYIGFPFEDREFYLVAPTFAQFQARCRPDVSADA